MSDRERIARLEKLMAKVLLLRQMVREAEDALKLEADAAARSGEETTVRVRVEVMQ